MSVLVFVDSKEGKIARTANEAIAYGKHIANAIGVTTNVLTYGNVDPEAAKMLGNYGADKVFVCSEVTQMDPQQLTKVSVAAVNETGAKVVICSHDFTGKSVAPRVSVALKAGMVAGAVDYPKTDSGFTVKKAVFSGKAFAHVSIMSEVKVITLMPNSVDVAAGEGIAEVVDFSCDAGVQGVTIKEFKKKGGEGISLTEADLVVSAGRGLKGPENWGMVEELAEILGAATACSRPVADIGWRPHHEHVGQTGVAIGPNLYIAIGISGAIQHLAGVNRSKVIVVINTDADAPFFKAADYGIIGDAFEVVPKLVAAFRGHKASQN